MIDQEEACNRLNTYDDCLAFLTTLSSSSKFAKKGKTSPLLGSIESAAPEKEEEPKNDRAQPAHPEPDDNEWYSSMVNMIGSLIKGKAKGKGWEAKSFPKGAAPFKGAVKGGSHWRT